MEEQFDEVEGKVRDVIKEVLQAEDSEVKKTATIADLGGDSLSALAILSALEREFDIDIPDNEALGIDSFATAVEAVRKHVS